MKIKKICAALALGGLVPGVDRLRKLGKFFKQSGLCRAANFAEREVCAKPDREAYVRRPEGPARKPS